MVPLFATPKLSEKVLRKGGSVAKRGCCEKGYHRCSLRPFNSSLFDRPVFSKTALFNSLDRLVFVLCIIYSTISNRPLSKTVHFNTINLSLQTVQFKQWPSDFSQLDHFDLIPFTLKLAQNDRQKVSSVNSVSYCCKNGDFQAQNSQNNHYPQLIDDHIESVAIASMSQFILDQIEMT